MRFLSSLITLGLMCYGGFWLWNNNSQFRETVQQYIENGEFLTLEARFSPEQIMDAHKQELLTDHRHTYQNPTLKFYPYLLMEVKYPLSSRRTREGVILWSMVDGEMVLDTQTWEKTHGFEDAINSHASRTDFLIINTLARHGGALTRERLQRELNQDQEIIDSWIESAKDKHLIVLRGNELRLHFQNPKFTVTPETRINQWLVTKTYNHAQRVSQRYNQKHIERVVKSAFGNDFTVRNAKIVYVPVYNIEVLNPDGSILTSYWNALNGQRLDTNYYRG